MSNVTYKGQILTIDSWDSKPMHDFGDNSTWPSTDDSNFPMRPPADEIWVVHSVRMRISVNADMTPMTVEYYIHPEMVPNATEPVKAKETLYENMNAFVRRFNRIGVLPIGGNGAYTANMWDLQYDFNEPIILKGTFDPLDPGLIEFSMRINDDVPIKTIGDSGDVEMAEVVYPDIAIYKIPSNLLE